MLIDKTVTFRSAHDKTRMQDPAILRERAKVDIELNDELANHQAIVEVTLTDGTHLNERVDAVRGTAANPMSREEVVAKCRDLVTPVLGTHEMHKPHRESNRAREGEGHTGASALGSG